MLTHLHIKNFAIIGELDIDFRKGMTVLTGETGTGKSILIDAIELALGKRASTDIIYKNAERADICLTLDINGIKPAKDFLRQESLSEDETNSCIIRRVITRDGRSQSTINYTPVTQKILRAFSDTFINIHGQHEFQTLLDTDRQREILDRFGGHLAQTENVNMIYKDWRKTKIEIETLETASHDISQKMEFLNYQIEELEALNLTTDELSQIEADHSKAANADMLINQGQTACALLADETGESPSIMQLLNKIQEAFCAIQKADTNFNEPLALIENAAIQIQEAQQSLNHYLNQIDINPDYLQQLEQRLNDIHRLARKHHIAADALPNLHQTLIKQRSSLQTSEEQLQELKETATQLEKDYDQAAKQLSACRQKTAKKLGDSVTKYLKKLGMPSAKLEIQCLPIQEKSPAPYGLEKPLFFIQTNPDHDPQPLSQIASGGELSRICLAVQTVIAHINQLPILIFDEIDSGIGGRTAEIVGSLLRRLGEKAQIFCITHLPQVAAKGHYHLSVQKTIKKGVTQITVNPLNPTERIQETARMLGGVKITEQTLAHAQEMLEDNL